LPILIGSEMHPQHHRPNNHPLLSVSVSPSHSLDEPSPRSAHSCLLRLPAKWSTDYGGAGASRSSLQHHSGPEWSCSRGAESGWVGGVGGGSNCGAGRGDFIQVEVQALPTRMLLNLSEELRGCPMVRGCFLFFLFVPPSFLFLICCIMHLIPFPDLESICLIDSIF